MYCASVALLPPGAAHRSSTVSPGLGDNAAQASWDASPCTWNRPCLNSFSAVTSPLHSTYRLSGTAPRRVAMPFRANSSSSAPISVCSVFTRTHRGGGVKLAFKISSHWSGQRVCSSPAICGETLYSTQRRSVSLE